MNKIYLEHSTVTRLARGMIEDIIPTDMSSLDPIKIWPVPRGGIPVAYILAKFRRIIIVDDVSDCDVIVDDIIDSGKTRDRYLKQYPDKKFLAMINPGDYDSWIVFPWETTLNGVDTSANDIPIRLLEYIGEDVTRGGLKETPRRFLKAWEQYTSGYGIKPSSILKVFEDGAEDYDQLVLIKNIPVYSHCEHHLAPFFGVAHIGYLPDKKIVGLSKLSRLTDIFARRLQVQERLTNQIAQALQDALNPKGVAVVLECRHMCMEARGIQQQGTSTVTSAMKGALLEDSKARAEFMGLI